MYIQAPGRAEAADMLQVYDDTGNAMHYLSAQFQKTVDDHSPRALIVGTHPNIPLVGDSFVSHNEFPDSVRDKIVGTPEDVLAALRLLIHRQHGRYTLVMAGFESHHYHGRNLTDFMEALQYLSHGVVLISDYAFDGEQMSTVQPHTLSRIEKVQHDAYGSYREWFTDHAVFTPNTFMNAVHSTEWGAVQGLSFSEWRVGMIASPPGGMNQSELNQVVKKSLTLR